MKISKTGFINLIRCDRFAALEQIYYEEEKSLVTFSDNMDDLMTMENINKRNQLLADMEKEDSDEDNDADYNVLEPYYNEVEYLTSRAVKHYFEGELTYSANTLTG